MVEPATAHVVQAALGSRAHAMDVTNACNSFLNGIDLARSMILAGRARRALVVTGETPTRVMRPRVTGLRQARTAFAGFTFGDAGAAVLVEPVATGGIVDVDAETHSRALAGRAASSAAAPGIRAATSTPTSPATATGCAASSRRSAPACSSGCATAPGCGWDDYAKVLVHQVTLPYLERFVRGDRGAAGQARGDRRRAGQHGLGHARRAAGPGAAAAGAPATGCCWSASAAGSA